MTNNENSKMVKIRITDHNGHTTLEQNVDEAATTVVNQHFNQGKWAYVGSRVFQFTAVDSNDTENLLKDTLRLKQMFDESDAPIVTMAGDLQGGTNAMDSNTYTYNNGIDYKCSCGAGSTFQPSLEPCVDVHTHTSGYSQPVTENTPAGQTSPKPSSLYIDGKSIEQLISEIVTKVLRESGVGAGDSDVLDAEYEEQEPEEDYEVFQLSRQTLDNPVDLLSFVMEMRDEIEAEGRPVKIELV